MKTFTVVSVCLGLVVASDELDSMGLIQQRKSKLQLESQECKVEVFQHGDFSGWKAQFGIGTYAFKQFLAAGAINDDMSSIKVYGDGCQATVFQHDLTGWSATFGQGTYGYRAFLAKGAKNDQVSSIMVANPKAAAKVAAEKKAADDAAAAAAQKAAAKKAAEEAAGAMAYVSKQKGVISYGGEKWLESSIAKGSGVMACYRTVMEDPQCVKDYFSYVERGDKNCGCHTASGFGIRNDDNSDIYQITAAAATALSGVIRLPLNSNECPSGSQRISDLADCKEVLSRLVYPYNDYYQNNPHQDRPTGCIWHRNGNGYFNPSGKVNFFDQAPICRKR